MGVDPSGADLVAIVRLQSLQKIFTNKIKLAILASETLVCENQNFSNKMLSPMGIEPGTSAIQVWCSPFLANLAFACKFETLSSAYSHALSILTKPSSSKNQVVQEQKTV